MPSWYNVFSNSRKRPMTELQRLETEIKKGIFDNNTLRLAVKAFGTANTFDRIGRANSVSHCGDCRLLCFATTLKSCYGGIKWICSSCSTMYTHCDACSSLILVGDTSLHF